MIEKWYYLMYKSPEDGRWYSMNVEDYNYLMNINVECMLFEQNSGEYSKFNKNDKNIDIRLGLGDIVQVVKYFDDTEEKVTIFQIFLCILFWLAIYGIYCIFDK